MLFSTTPWYVVSSPFNFGSKNEIKGERDSDILVLSSSTAF